ncbi:hypothetical protein FOXYSP1_02071 [Fusarium oxysporum f. sp. phaseoli]
MPRTRVLWASNGASFIIFRRFR